MTVREIAVAAAVLTLLPGELTGAPVQTSGFYIITVSFSDFGPSTYYRVLEVTAEGGGSRVRYSRLAPADVSCSRRIVQSTDALVERRPPGQLAGSWNPCAVKPEKLDELVKKHSKPGGDLEWASIGIVAQCGDATVVLGLPDASQVDLKKVRRVNRNAARLWGLPSEVHRRAFGSKDPLRDPEAGQELAIQRAGERVVPGLRSGRYDAGLRAAQGGVSSFGQLLDFYYRGPVSDQELRGIFVLRLVNMAADRFERYTAPPYPLLARAARLEGVVDLRLRLQPETGDVIQAEAGGSGHALLQQSAIEAARKWTFKRPLASEVVSVAVEYAMRCP